MTARASDGGSATTETLSDFDGAVSEARGKREVADFLHGEVSGSEDQDVDSEATVTDPDPWESDQDMDTPIPWQPAQRLTARQVARQERLLQGIHQTQWNDMHLPRGLDLRNKARQKEIVSEEQHLRRVKAAEVRRAQTQKAKRDTMEITKARIRAATSNRFRDMVGNAQTERREGRRHAKLLHGRIRYRHRPRSSVMVLPEGRDIPVAIAPRSLSHYPLPKVVVEYSLSDDFSDDGLKLGSSMTVNRTNEQFSISLDGRCLGRLVPTASSRIDASRLAALQYPMEAILTGIRRSKAPRPKPESIVLTAKAVEETPIPLS